MKSIRVFAPASVSNLGCGFDVFGLAIDSPGDEVTVRWSPSGKTYIKKLKVPVNSCRWKFRKIQPA